MFTNRRSPRNHRPDSPGLPLDNKLFPFLCFLTLLARLSPFFATLTKKHRGYPPLDAPLLNFYLKCRRNSPRFNPLRAKASVVAGLQTGVFRLNANTRPQRSSEATAWPSTWPSRLADGAGGGFKGRTLSHARGAAQRASQISMGYKTEFEFLIRNL